MKTLSGSLVMLAGALMIGAASVAQAVAITAGWRDTPVSMLVIGGVFLGIGALVVIAGFRSERAVKMLSGSVLVCCSAIVFACAKIAMAIAFSANGRVVPAGMLVIGSVLACAGFVLLTCGLLAARADRLRTQRGEE